MSTRSRIVHVVNFFDPRTGYAEYYLAKKQQEKGHEVFVVTSDALLSTSEKRIGLFNEEGVRVFRLSSFLEYSGNVFVSANSLKAILTNLSPHIIHLHNVLSPLAWMIILHKDAIGCKIVGDVITGKVTAEGLSLAVKTSILKVCRATFLPLLFNRIDCFFVNSEASLEWIDENLRIAHSRIRFVPLGADAELFCFQPQERNVIRKRLRIGNRDVVAIYSGRLLPHKKVDTLLFAAAPIIRKNKSFRLLVVGRGSNDYVDHLRKMTDKLGISSGVIFHDQVHRTELRSFYSAVDFAIWPGSPSMSIIEAMSTSLPVIITRSNWTNHLLEYGNGLSCVEGDITDLRASIESLVENNDLRRKMGKKSRELVEEKLSWDNIATRYSEIYRELIEHDSSLHEKPSITDMSR